MPISINGVELCDDEVERELALHGDSDDPLRTAVTTCILRRVLLDEAQHLGVNASDEEQAISCLLETHASSPEPDEAACRRFYDAHPVRFTEGACMEAEHILFQVTPRVNLAALQSQAEDVLELARRAPERFAELARQYSNCPSAAVGGSLGLIQRGATAPEFERAVFGAEVGKVHPRLIHTRHGLHIVRVIRSVAGRLRPYETVAEDIARVLKAMGRDTAWRQYVRILVAGARIEGIDFGVELGGERLRGEGLPV